MLDEPGPLSLIPEDVIPAPGPRRVFEGLAAAFVQELRGAALGLDVSGGDLARADDAGLAADLALHAGAAAHALGDQPPVNSSEIGGIVAGVDGLDGELGGLMADAARDLNMPDPSIPEFPPMPPYVPPGHTGPVLPAPPPPPANPDRGYWREQFRDVFRTWASRDPSAEEYAIFEQWYDGAGTVTAASFSDWAFARFPFLYPGGSSAPQPPPPQPPPPSGTPSGDLDDCALLALYAERNPSEAGKIGAFLASNPGDCGRAPGALNLPGWAEFVARL